MNVINYLFHSEKEFVSDVSQAHINLHKIYVSLVLKIVYNVGMVIPVINVLMVKYFLLPLICVLLQLNRRHVDKMKYFLNKQVDVYVMIGV